MLFTYILAARPSSYEQRGRPTRGRTSQKKNEDAKENAAPVIPQRTHPNRPKRVGAKETKYYHEGTLYEETETIVIDQYEKPQQTNVVRITADKIAISQDLVVADYNEVMLENIPWFRRAEVVLLLSFLFSAIYTRLIIEFVDGGHFFGQKVPFLQKRSSLKRSKSLL